MPTYVDILRSSGMSLPQILDYLKRRGLAERMPSEIRQLEQEIAQQMQSSPQYIAQQKKAEEKEVAAELGSTLLKSNRSYVPQQMLRGPQLNPQAVALMQRAQAEAQQPNMIEVEVEPEPSIYEKIMKYFDQEDEE